MFKANNKSFKSDNLSCSSSFPLHESPPRLRLSLCNFTHYLSWSSVPSVSFFTRNSPDESIFKVDPVHPWFLFKNAKSETSVPFLFVFTLLSPSYTKWIRPSTKARSRVVPLFRWTKQLLPLDEADSWACFREQRQSPVQAYLVGGQVTYPNFSRSRSFSPFSPRTRAESEFIALCMEWTDFQRTSSDGHFFSPMTQVMMAVRVLEVDWLTPFIEDASEWTTVGNWGR